MKKIIFIIICLSFCYYIYQIYSNKKDKLFTVAIIQGASHIAVDQANENFKNELSKLLNNNVEFISFNTEGSAANAYALAQQLKNNNKIDLFFTIDTATTLAFYKSIQNKPIVFMAVENPNELEILGENKLLAGITDAIPENIILELINGAHIKKKRIGLLYKNETSKQIIFTKIKKILDDNDYSYIDMAINNEAEIMDILSNNIYKIDVLFSSTDNMIASSFPIITNIANSNHIPFFVCLANGAEQGAYCSVGMKYEDNGFDAAKIAYDILMKKIKPFDIPLQFGSYRTWYFNKKTANKINIPIPEHIENKIIKIL